MPGHLAANSVCYRVLAQKSCKVPLLGSRSSGLLTSVDLYGNSCTGDRCGSVGCIRGSHLGILGKHCARFGLRPNCSSWADGKAELHDKALAVGGRTLFEHLLTMFCDFRCAERCPPHAGDLRRMTPTKYGIWKMHPPKLRVYGWCPGKNQFAAVTAALKSETKSDKKLNGKKLEQVRNFIKANGLEGAVLRGDILAVFPHTA